MTTIPNPPRVPFGTIYYRPLAKGRVGVYCRWTENGQKQSPVSVGKATNPNQLKLLNSAAQRRLIEEEERIRTGVGITPADRRVSLEAFATDWLDKIDASKRAPNTKLNYRRAVEAAVEHWGTTLLTEIKARAVEQYLRILLKQGFSARTYNLHRDTLKTLFNAALGDELIIANPVLRTEKQTVDQVDQAPYTSETRDKVLALLPRYHGERNVPLKAYCTFLAYTGLRRTEACQLKPQDILPATEKYPHGAVRLLSTSTKGRKTEYIPLTPEAVEALREARRNRTLQIDGSDTLFGFQGKTFSVRLKRVLDRTPYKGVTLHYFRHALASILLNEVRVPITTVQAWLRHSSIEITRKYLHDGDQALASAAAALSSLKSGSGEEVAISESR